MCPASPARRMDGKVCSRKPSLCADQPSSPTAQPPPRNPAVRCPSIPSPRQHFSQPTSPTYVLDPVYFLEDSVSLRAVAQQFLAVLFSVTSVFFLRDLCVEILLFLPSKNKKRPDPSERFSNFNFLFLNLFRPSVSPAFHLSCSPASALSGPPAN